MYQPPSTYILKLDKDIKKFYFAKNPFTVCNPKNHSASHDSANNWKNHQNCLKILIFFFYIKKTPFWFKLAYCITTLTGALAVFTLFNASSSKSFYNSPLISGFIRLTPRTDNEWQKVPQSSLLLKGLPLKDMFFYAKIFAARNSLGWPKSREKT